MKRSQGGFNSIQIGLLASFPPSFCSSSCIWNSSTSSTMTLDSSSLIFSSLLSRSQDGQYFPRIVTSIQKGDQSQDSNLASQGSQPRLCRSVLVMNERQVIQQ